MKLLTLLKSLHPEEYKDFEKFLQSPFFKASDKYLQFFRCLCKHYPSFDLEKEDLEAAYRRCFGQQSLNDSKLYNLMSGLSKQIEQYLVVRMVLSPEDKQSPVYDHLLVKSLGIRNMGSYFRKEARRLIGETMERPRKTMDDYLLLSQLHYEVYFNADTSKSEEESPHLKLAAEYLDLHYCMVKLQVAAEMKTRERIFSFRYETPLLDEVLGHSAMADWVDAHPLLAINHSLVNLYQKGVDEPGFRGLMALFVGKYAMISKVDQSVLLPHLINCGASLLRRDHAVEAELLSLYKLAIQANVLLDGNRITHISFLNIASLAGHCKEFDWAYAFIEQFSPYLEESKRQPTVDLTKAGLYYNQGLLDEAQNCLKPELFQIAFFDVIARALLIRIAFDHYLLNGRDYEFLSAQIHAFDRFVQVQGLATEKKAADLNWIKFVRKMVSLKFDLVEVPESKKETLRISLKQLQPVRLKKWLEQAIERL
jgi:hypothetical protein